MHDIEQVSDKFDQVKYFQARERTLRILEDSARLFQLGMSEVEAKKIIEDMLKENGVIKNWHPTKVRFGINTIKSFKEESVKDIVLKKDDVFFIDIGPIWDEHEGDLGKTFVIGEYEEGQRIKKTCEKIFNLCLEMWRRDKLTGVELYKYAQKLAVENGYVLNMNMKGHRLGDFPHHVFYRGGLNEVETTPIEDLWVLEIHIRHQEKQIGAFYEDIISTAI